jgi:hypothetical protein
MTRPVVIVDPSSSGIELAPTFKSRGIPAVGIKLRTEDWPEFGSKMVESDFFEVIPDQPGIFGIVQKYNPIAIIPGTEEGIPLAEGTCKYHGEKVLCWDNGTPPSTMH